MAVRKLVSTIILTSTLGLIGWMSTKADTPLAPPDTVVKLSQNRQSVIISDINGKSTRIYHVYPQGETSLLWSIDGWHRNVFVSNAGDYVAVCFNGDDLIDPSITAQDKLITFYHNGHVVAVVHFGDVIRNMDLLPKTVSHRYWGRFVGFDASRFIVVTSQNRRVAIDPASGKTVSSIVDDPVIERFMKRHHKSAL